MKTYPCSPFCNGEAVKLERKITVARAALEEMVSGWDNILRLGAVDEKYETTATILRNKARAALRTIG